jgi:AraC family transcriptional regulator
MSPSSNEIQKDEYRFRLNRAIDYIQNHYSEDLNLAKLAEVTHFSKYHFYRLFHECFGETVHECIQRVRLERASHLLVANVHASIAEIAEMCGFSSSQNFARVFRGHFGFSPTLARKNADLHMIGNSENAKTGGENETPLSVAIKELPSYRVAYIRDIGPYRSESNARAMELLLGWALAKGFLDGSMRFMGVCWNDPETTPPQECIFDACLTIPENVQDDGEVRIQYLPGGKLAVLHCEADWETISTIRKRLFNEWLPASGFQRDDRPLFFIHYNNHNMNRLKLAIVDMCLPIKP